MMYPKKNYTKDRKKRAMQRKKPSFSESALQKACEDVADYYKVPYIRIPDAVYKYIFGASYIPVHIKVLIANFIKSLPDMTLLFPNGKYKCIELKTDKGKLRAGQKQFMNLVGIQNYEVVRTQDRFIEIIKEGLNIEKNNNG